MKRIDITPIDIDLNKYKKTTAKRSDVSRLIKEDCIIYCDNQPTVLYKKLTTDTSGLRWAVKNIKYGKGKRLRGLVSQSSIFGYSPRLTIRQDFCSATAMAQNEKKQHHIITEFAKELTGVYAEYFPEQFKYHNELVDKKVMKEWTIGGSPFTSGIVNKNNALKYHFDSGNFRGVLSNMVVFKKEVDGGYLVIPALDIALEVEDNTLTIFNGQDILHGVSNIEYRNELAYRYSIVYYSLERMWQCEPLNDEIARIKKKKTIREKNRIDPEHIERLQNRKKEFEESAQKEILANMKAR